MSNIRWLQADSVVDHHLAPVIATINAAVVVVDRKLKVIQKETIDYHLAVI